MSGRLGAGNRYAGLLTAAAMLAAGCIPGSASPSPNPTTTQAATDGPSIAAPTTVPTAAPTITPTASPRAAQWVAAGALNPPRALTHAIRIAGGDVLVVGDDWTGCNAEGPALQDAAADADVYRAATGTWDTVANLNALRAGLAAVPLADGRALVLGGMTEEGIPFSSVKIFDPAAGTWSQPGLMGSARIEPSASLLKDGRVLATGGWFSTAATGWRLVPTSEVFDPATGLWTNTGVLHTLRWGARAVTLTDGRVLVVGGRRDVIDNFTPTTEIWNPATGVWSNAGPLPAARSGFSLVALADGSALLVGGIGTAGTIPAAASALRFDPGTLNWSSAGTVTTAATDRTAVVLGDGRVLVAGGFVGTTATAAAELFDPASGTWTPTVPLPEPRRYAVAAALADGSALLVGGVSRTIVPGGPGTGSGSGCPVIVPGALRYVPPMP